MLNELCFAIKYPAMSLKIKLVTINHCVVVMALLTNQLSPVLLLENGFETQPSPSLIL